MVQGSGYRVQGSGYEARFLSGKLESGKLTALDNCFLGIEAVILTPNS
jgi:hypothetical protein